MIPEIIKLNMNFAPSVHALLQKAGRSLAKAGIEQWDELYPALADVAGDLESGTGYGIIDLGKPAAYMVLNQFNEPQYEEVEFELPAAASLAIHRLAVDPDYQGRGYAGMMVGFAEKFAADLGYSSMRLDAFSGNPVALELYEKRGYIRRGTVQFRKGSFHLYEKVLR